ncbi:MAG: hypothetical protein LBT74_13005 [Acidobacteriota bacterium]|nr:hypothetical protein [Acidobacteriota bacterium]
MVKTYAFKKGMPGFRFTFVPHPITGIPAELCNKYLQGSDPLTGKPVLGEIIDAITRPLSAEDASGGVIERPTPRLVAADTEENLHKLFLENGWTDGLPVVLPTEARVAEMLKGTSHEPDEVVGAMQASSPHEAWSYTVEQVAVNAVMAGAKPEHLPVILAIASMGGTSISTSTTSFAGMVVVNGPVREELKMNSGIGALGPFNHSNAVIGRAWTLISLNLGASGKPGEIYMGSLGNNYNYNNLCFPENEEDLPEGWNPLHVQKGFKPGESVVSTFLGWGFTHPDQSFGKPFHDQIPFWLKFVSPFSSTTLLLDPTIIKQLKENEGFGSKEQLIDWIHKNTKVTVGAWLDDYYAVQNFVLPYGRQGQEPLATWMKMPRDAEIPQFRSPGNINVLSLGGGTNFFWQAGDFGYLASASVDKWR